MGRLKLNTPLLLGILLGSLMPMLYLVQWVVKRGTPQETWLNGTLHVSVEGQKPLILPINLHEEHSSQGTSLQGTGTLQEGAYPWEPVPFEAQFFLHLDSANQAPNDSNPKLEWAASYSERLTTRNDGLGLPPLPCKGSIEVLDQEKSTQELGLSAFSELRVAVDLACTSAGSDLLWSSGDEKVWTIRGPLGLSRGPTP